MKTLFDDVPLAPTDTNVLPEDVARLSKQCQLILAKLKTGPCTNYELAGVALKYTSRISDLRKHGFNVRMTERRKDGTTIYELV